MNEVCQAAVITNGTVTNVIFAEESSVATLVANEKYCFADLDVIAIGAGGNYKKVARVQELVVESSSLRQESGHAYKGRVIS